MARAVSLMLSGVGVEHETVAEGEAAIELVRLYDYDAILLDLTLPDVHGYEVVCRMRLARITTPVMILSGDGETATKVSGFGFGADDYVTKPFQRDELVARLHALARRSKGMRNRSSALARWRSTCRHASSPSTTTASR